MAAGDEEASREAIGRAGEDVGAGAEDWVKEWVPWATVRVLRKNGRIRSFKENPTTAQNHSAGRSIDDEKVALEHFAPLSVEIRAKLALFNRPPDAPLRSSLTRRSVR